MKNPQNTITAIGIIEPTITADIDILFPKE